MFTYGSKVPGRESLCGECRDFALPYIHDGVATFLMVYRARVSPR